jgi:hypothetical protein
MRHRATANPIRSAGQNRPGDLSRFIAQGLRSSETPPKKGKWKHQKQNPLRTTASTQRACTPMLSSEPAPSSPRPWASAWARPRADEPILPCTIPPQPRSEGDVSPLQRQKGGPAAGRFAPASRLMLHENQTPPPGSSCMRNKPRPQAHSSMRICSGSRRP